MGGSSKHGALGDADEEAPTRHAVRTFHVDAHDESGGDGGAAAGAATRRGRQVYRTLTEAMGAAQDGDIVEVASGEYAEGLRVDKAITICAAPGALVVVRNTGDAAVISTAYGARLIRISFEHCGGDSNARGRQGPRCLEVVEGSLTCEDCSFTSEVGSAVMAAENGSVVMRRCKLFNCGRCGLICVLGGKAFCENCELVDNGLNGVDVQSRGTAILRDSSVLRNTQTGVLVADPLSFARIQGNDVSHNGRRGITAQKHGCFTLVGNRVTQNQNIGVIGIGPWDKDQALDIRDNEIIGNYAAGIWVQRGDANITRNSVRGNHDCGVVAFGAGSTINMTGNQVAGNKGVGVSVHSAKQVTLDSNLVGAVRERSPSENLLAFMMGLHQRLGEQSPMYVLNEACCHEVVMMCVTLSKEGNIGTGVELLGCEAILIANQICDNHDHGLISDSSTLALERNELSDNKGAGLVLRGATSQCRSRDNILLHNGQFGLQVTAGAEYQGVGGDTVASNLVGGVLVKDATVCNLAGLLIASNQGHGISVETGSKAHISHSNIWRNEGAGVWVAGAATLRASASLAENSQEVVTAEGTVEFERPGDPAPSDEASPYFPSCSSLSLGRHRGPRTAPIVSQDLARQESAVAE